MKVIENVPPQDPPVTIQFTRAEVKAIYDLIVGEDWGDLSEEQRGLLNRMYGDLGESIGIN